MTFDEFKQEIYDLFDFSGLDYTFLEHYPEQTFGFHHFMITSVYGEPTMINLMYYPRLKHWNGSQGSAKHVLLHLLDEYEYKFENIPSNPEFQTEHDLLIIASYNYLKDLVSSKAITKSS